MTTTFRVAENSDVRGDALPEPRLVIVKPAAAEPAPTATRSKRKAQSSAAASDPNQSKRGTIKVILTPDMTDEQIQAAIEAARAGNQPAEPTPAATGALRHGTSLAADLPGPTQLKVRSRPKQRGTRDEDASYSSDEIFARLIASPSAFRNCDNYRIGRAGGPGLTYPKELYSVLWALLRWELCTKALREALGSPFSTKRQLLIAALLKNLPDDEYTDEDRRMIAELLASRFPHRTTIERFWRKHLDIEAGNVALGDLGAQTMAGWQARDGVSPELASLEPTQVLRGDGTALQGSSSVHYEWNVDPETHEVWRSPIDEAVLPHHEGGRSETVFGTKIASIQAVGSKPGELVCLGMDHVPSPNPQTEAAVSVALLLSFLTRHRDKVDVAGLAYDCALGADLH